MMKETEMIRQEIIPSVTLLVDLSRPISLPGELFEIIQKAFRQYFGNDYDVSLKAAVLQNPRQALLFIKSKEFGDKLLSERAMSFGGPLTATFTHTSNLCSEYIEINTPEGPQSLALGDLQGLTDPHTFNHYLMFHRSSSVLVRLPSADYVKTVEKKHQFLPFPQSPHIVTLSDHCCIDCWWISSVSLPEAVTRLKRCGESLFSVIQGIFALMSEQPCILDVSISSKSIFASEENPDLILICCTIKDAEIIRRLLFLEIGTIGKLILDYQYLETEQRGSEGSGFTEEDMENNIGKSESECPSYTDCFIFWDLDTCPLPEEISLEKVKQVVHNITTVLHTRGMDLSTRGNFVFLTDTSFQGTFLDWKNLVPDNFEVVLSTQRSATVSAMKNEIEVLVRSQENQELKSAICCISDDVEFKFILKNLISEGFTQLLLLYATHSSLIDIVPQADRWGDVLALKQKEQQSVIDLNLRSDDSGLSHKKQESLQNPSLERGPTHFVKSVRVSRFSMAAHLNNIMKWNEEDTSPIVQPTEIENILRNQGTDSEIEVSIDRDKRKQKIIVSGSSEDSVKEKVVQVEILLAKLSSNRKVLRLHGWKSSHREAMMGSTPLNTISQSFRTTVVFHVTDGHIVGEMMSTTEIGILRMSEYLKSLQPVEARWKFDPKYLIPEPRIRFWNSIRNKYAVMFEKTVIKGVLEVQAWGFGSLLQDVHAELQSAAMGRPIPPSAIVSSSKPEKILRAPPTDSFQIAEYQLQDSEVSYFYQSFEEMFQSYLKTSYHVLVTVAPVSQSADHLVLDIRGSPNDISSARAYLDQIRKNLNCREVCITVYNEEMYHEIFDIKEAHMRGSIPDTIRVSSMDEDPLLCPGLMAIHVIPPSLQHGYTRFSFPCEIKIRLSESWYSSRLHGNRSEQSPKLARVCEQYHNLRPLGQTRIPADWSSYAQKGLIVEPPGLAQERAEFGGDFVSEEVRQWLSAMSSPGSSFSGHFSAGESLLDNNPYHSPRKSFSEVLKTSSGSIAPTFSMESESHLDSYRRTVHWPHSSFRYMFLGERMKIFIHETVQLIRTRHGESVSVTCPYRDKKDASVCMLLEGPQFAVDDSVNLFNHMLSEVLEQLRCMTVVMSGTQFTCLTAQDLVKVKAVQGSAGVHVMLSPTPNDLQTSIETIDLRYLENTTIKEDEIVRVRLPGFNKRQVDISVMSAPAEAPGWTWGVNTLFAVLEKDDDCGLTRQEIEKLNHGEVLVTSDFESGKTILRARISTSSISNTTMARALSGMPTEKLLSNVISRGLSQADILGINGIAVIAPDTLTELSSLGIDRIRSVTVSSVVDHVRTHQLFNLDRIVCLEVFRDTTAPTSSVMAETLCRLIKDSNEAKVPICNDAVCSSIVGKKKFESQNDTTHTVALKGIRDCLVVALEEIKEIIAR